MEKVRPLCGQPSDRGCLKEQHRTKGQRSRSRVNESLHSCECWFILVALATILLHRLIGRWYNGWSLIVYHLRLVHQGQVRFAVPKASLHCTNRWLGSLVVWASDLRLDGRGFVPQPPHYRWLALGWVTVFGRHTISVNNQPSRPTQPPTVCGTGNEYRPKCGDALRLGVKAGWLIAFVCGWLVKLCDPFNTCHPERFRDEFHKNRRVAVYPGTHCNIG